MQLTQEQFCAKIGIKRNSLAQIEVGKRCASNLVLTAICREYNVSYDWLMTGNGNMYAPLSDDDINFVSDIVGDLSENKKKLMRLIAQMPDDLLDRMMEYLEGKQKK